MNNHETREIIIGACAVLVLVGSLVFMNTRPQHAAASGDEMLVHAKFNKIDGLADGAEVRMGGIAIGRVVAMELDTQFRAVITMRIDNPIDLPKDSSASIHTDGLFGSKFIVLEPGAEEAVLKSGGEFVYTQDAVVVSDLLELIISEGKSARAAKEEKPAAKGSGG